MHRALICLAGFTLWLTDATPASVDSSRDDLPAHWAFVPPTRPEVPGTTRATWPRNAVDAFVLARLEREGLVPSREADRRTLIRRVTLDLTGLPPTPEAVEAFVADTDAGAYERVVDRLLESPHFGERMAVHWLDLARYADTNGYSIDGGRHMWAWRDWVIDAFNNNKPFDQFTIEQLAGDLLPNATTSQKIASGFNRNHMNTHEGGTIEEEYRVAYVADRVRTTAQAWMGLTMACAQCHDHKYDPISQIEYYRFFAFFNTITDRGNDGNAGVNSVPFIPVFSSDQLAELRQLQADLDRMTHLLFAPDPDLDAAQAAWEAQERVIEREPPALHAWALAGPYPASTADDAFCEDPVDVTTAEPDPSVWVVQPDLEDGRVHPLHGDRRSWYLRRTITMNRAGQVTLSLGSDDAIKVWLNETVVLENNTRRGAAPDQEMLTIQLSAGKNVLVLKIVNDGGPAGFYFKLIESGPPETIVRTIREARDQRSDEQVLALRQYYRSVAPELDPLRTRIELTRAEIAAIEEEPITTTMVMEEMQGPRETFVLSRGRYDLPRDPVSPGTPDCLPPMPDDAPRSRLGLAEWLVDPSHPLTARVAVNSYWQMLFGTGLVETSEDFGTQGESPSHPALLDWLATEFVASGWDVKAMLRLLVTSAVYRQSSETTTGLVERDPDNRLLARGPRFRLHAEFIRDSALAASGLLVKEIGGPSVRPYQPDGLWKEMSHFGSTPATEQVYVRDSGAKLYRRSLYTIWKRTVPPPPMAAFDAPNREICVSRRARTNTPLQALVLMNETGFVEAARALAQRMMCEGGDSDEDRLGRGFALVLARQPDSYETDVLLELLRTERAVFARNQEAAAALLAVGDSAQEPALGAADLAAWTMVANLILNLSETCTRE